MAIWFRKSKTQKWHIATYGGSIAECGRDIHIAAAYATERMTLGVDKSEGVQNLCQACLNSIKRGREYIKRLEEKQERECTY